MLLGNKADLSVERVVKHAEGAKLAEVGFLTLVLGMQLILCFFFVLYQYCTVTTCIASFVTYVKGRLC